MPKHELIGKEFKVLSHGSIMLVDYMGSDEEIENAARISYGEGTRPVSETRTLLRYLKRHWHTTPFEMAELKFKIKMPMDVNRQWIRHRTACLSGDTQLVFSRPCDGKAYRMSVKDVFDKFQPTENKTRPDKQKNAYHKKDRVQSMNLRCINEDTGEVLYTNIVDIWESGVKTCYLLTLKNGRSIKCSADHRIFTPSGWTTLKNLSVGDEVITASPNINDNIPYFNTIDADIEQWLPMPDWEDYYEISDQGRVRRIVGGRGSSSYGRCKKLTISNGRAKTSLNRPGKQETILVHRQVLRAFDGEPESDSLLACHIDGNSLNNSLENLYWGNNQDNADDMIAHGTTTRLTSMPVKIKSIVEIGQEMTYDLEVSGRWHNFAADDIIVHNSVNEYSTRYSNPIDDTDTTSVWRKQSTNNKQGSEGEVTEWPDSDRVKDTFGPEIASGLTPQDFLSELEQEVIQAGKSFYEITQEFGVAKEVSRKHLPLSTYTEIFWKCDLHNIMHFLRLRCDSHAQQEIREYANIMAGICKELFPLSMEAWYDYAHMSRNFSRQEMRVLQHLLDREQIRNSDVLKTLAQQVGLYDPNRKSNREYDEFVKKFSDSYSSGIDTEFQLP